MVVFETLFAVLAVSLVSFVGAFGLFLNEKFQKRILPFMISFAVGAMLGAAFFDLIPESLQLAGVTATMAGVLLGILSFFMFEKFLYWYHCHYYGACDIHEVKKKSVASLSLFGDAIHNFIDGMIIAASFLADSTLGIVTSIAVVFHEIPSELGDFGILMRAGFPKTKALFYNFLSALTAFLGAGLVLLVSSKADGLTNLLLPFAAGGFIYIAGSDLLPELHEETGPRRSFIQLIFILLGIALIYLAGVFFAE